MVIYPSFEIYQGKSGEDGVIDGYGLGESVILNMSKELEQKGHEIYFDNYFNSVLLMETLYEKGIMACGTVRSDRKHLPGFIVDRAMTRGSMDMIKGSWLINEWTTRPSICCQTSMEQKRELCSTPRKMAHG